MGEDKQKGLKRRMMQVMYLSIFLYLKQSTKIRCTSYLKEVTTIVLFQRLEKTIAQLKLIIIHQQVLLMLKEIENMAVETTENVDVAEIPEVSA